MSSPQYDDAAIAAKWREFAGAVERLAERVADPDDFGVLAGSSIAGDDDRTHPFELSQAVRHLINASVDQLHGIKTVLVDAERQHLAVGFTLARAAIDVNFHTHCVRGPSLDEDGAVHVCVAEAEPSSPPHRRALWGDREHECVETQLVCGERM